MREGFSRSTPMKRRDDGSCKKGRDTRCSILFSTTIMRREETIDFSYTKAKETSVIHHTFIKTAHYNVTAMHESEYGAFVQMHVESQCCGTLNHCIGIRNEGVQLFTLIMDHSSTTGRARFDLLSPLLGVVGINSTQGSRSFLLCFRFRFHFQGLFEMA